MRLAKCGEEAVARQMQGVQDVRLKFGDQAFDPAGGRQVPQPAHALHSFYVMYLRPFDLCRPE
jgi:hypothetical protein